MSTSIYDDPVIEIPPTADELRIAELKAFIVEANEPSLLQQDSAAKELRQSLDEAIRNKDWEMQKAFDKERSRQLAPMREQFRIAQVDEAAIRLRLSEVREAKTELFSLSPLSKKLSALNDKLWRAQFNDNMEPIRPQLLDAIDKYQYGNPLLPPNPQMASVKRRDLKRHDQMLADIREEINEVSRQIGLTS